MPLVGVVGERQNLGISLLTAIIKYLSRPVLASFTDPGNSESRASFGFIDSPVWLMWLKRVVTSFQREATGW
ncbi:hypothetical protein GDO78_016889 [Eleutherodactylus coqui]|uniref:Uncharacterized protein n=1 Tax=Eleutherodactylus coqui TaxID=57060 RepID=A0A8J6BAP6_ELECQ|nr:hypothetical protein GDO78_016889 [Eleutherodactylus coqui]